MSGTKQVSVPVSSIVLIFNAMFPIPTGIVGEEEGLMLSISTKAEMIMVATLDSRSWMLNDCCFAFMLKSISPTSSHPLTVPPVLISVFPRYDGWLVMNWSRASQTKSLLAPVARLVHLFQSIFICFARHVLGHPNGTTSEV